MSQARNPGSKYRGARNAPGHLAKQGFQNSLGAGSVTKSSHEGPSGGLSMLGNKWAPGSGAQARRTMEGLLLECQVLPLTEALMGRRIHSGLIKVGEGTLNR